MLPASGSSSACVGAVQPNHRGNMAALFSSCSQVVGLAIFAAGIYLAVTGERYAVLTGSSIVAGAAILIVCGIITIGISVVGLVAAIGQFRWILLIVSSTRLINLSTLTLFTTPTPCHHTLAHIVTTPTCYQHTLTRFTITLQSHTHPNPNTHYYHTLTSYLVVHPSPPPLPMQFAATVAVVIILELAAGIYGFVRRNELVSPTRQTHSYHGDLNPLPCHR